MAKVNTSAQPTFLGQISKDGREAAFQFASNMQHEVESVLRNKVNQFGYNKSTAQIFRMGEGGESQLDSASTSHIWAPRVAGATKEPVERIEPNEAQFDGAAALSSYWLTKSRELKKVKAFSNEELNQIAQDTITQLINMGVSPRSITTMTRQHAAAAE